MPVNLRGRPGFRAPLALFGVAAVLGCGRAPSRYAREDVAASLASPIPPGTDMGRFLLAPHAVVDGDTIKVAGLDASLRLIALDTEETFKSEADRRAYEAGWELYLRGKASKAHAPVKIATPTGEQAKAFAQDFFRGVLEVRLERDSPQEIRCHYGRYLAYVFVERDGRWINYNLEVVRAGLSPYFTKYGYSKRFHLDFVSAQAEARAAGRGIWAPASEHYGDYERRIAWWNARAETIAAFERDAEGREDYFVLTHWDAPRRLATRIGDEVTILATVGDVRRRDHGPSTVTLSRRLFDGFPLVFRDPLVLEDSEIAERAGEYVRVRGVVRRHEFADGDAQLQIEIVDEQQIALPPYSTPPADPSPIASAPPPTSAAETHHEP